MCFTSEGITGQLSVGRVCSLQTVGMDWEPTLIWVHCLPFEVIWGLIVRDTLKVYMPVLPSSNDGSTGLWDQGMRSQYRADLTGTYAGAPPWEQGHGEQRGDLSSVLETWLCI